MRFLWFFLALTCFSQDLPPAPDLHLCPPDTEPDVLSKPAKAIPRNKDGTFSPDAQIVEGRNATVDVGLTVDVHGAATNLKVLQSLCPVAGIENYVEDDHCRAAAERISLAYVQQWRFRPATHCGHPVPFSATATVVIGAPLRSHHRP